MAKRGFTTWRSLIEYPTEHKDIHLLLKKQIIYRKVEIKTHDAIVLTSKTNAATWEAMYRMMP